MRGCGTFFSERAIAPLEGRDRTPELFGDSRRFALVPKQLGGLGAKPPQLFVIRPILLHPVHGDVVLAPGLVPVAELVMCHRQEKTVEARITGDTDRFLERRYSAAIVSDP